MSRNSLNKKDHIIGFSYPLKFQSGGYFQVNKSFLEQAKSNLKNLLLTIPGERFFNPDYGSKLYYILFENLTKADALKKITEIVEKDVNKWLPYLSVDNIELIEYNMNMPYNKIIIKISFFLNEFPEQYDSIELTYSI